MIDVNQPPQTSKRRLAAPAAEHDDPEMHAFAIACACVAWPRTARDIARIRRLAGRGYDAERLRAVALRHGVAALVADGLRAAAEPVPPGIERVVRVRAAAALAQLGETIALREILAGAGVAMLALKGGVLAQRLYGNVTLRESADIDIAVAPGDVAAAWDALGAAGFDRSRPAGALPPHRLARYLRAAKDSLHRRGYGSVVELHWRLSDEAAEPAIPPPGEWREVAVAPGRTLPTLGDARLFAYLCAHGAAHLWARLKWLADVATLLHTAPDGGAAWWAAAARHGDRRAVASAILLAHDVLAVPLPAGFVAPRSWRLRLLVALARRVLRAGGGTRELATTRWRGWAEFAAKLLVAPTPRHARHVIGRLLVSGDDVAAVALPPGLSPLYVVLRAPRLLRRRRARRISANRSR